MIIEQTENKKAIASGDFEKVKMTVSEEKAYKALQFLRNDIYTRKELAVLRELISNACDVMDLVGNKNPIDVHLPTDFEQVFRVRDYGTGLSDKDVKNVFSQYFESTKDKDNTQRGAMGIGSKAGFTISDSFTVTSYFNGVKTIYSLNLETKDGGTDAYCNRITSEPTSEPNGLEVEVPVRAGYVQNMIAEAKTLIPYMRRGNAINTNLEMPELEGLEQISDTLFVKNKSSSEIIVLMGNVPYAVKVDSVIQDTINKNESFKVAYRNFQIVFNVEIGEAVVAPSRENLQLVSKTYDCLDKYIQKADKELFDYVNAKLDGSQDPWERRLMLEEFQRLCRPLGKQDNILDKKISPINNKNSANSYCTIDASYWRAKKFDYYNVGIKSLYFFNDKKELKRTTLHSRDFEVEKNNQFFFTYKSSRITDVVLKIRELNPNNKIEGYIFQTEDSYNEFVNYYDLTKVGKDHILLHEDIVSIKESLPKQERGARTSNPVPKVRVFVGKETKATHCFDDCDNDEDLDGIYFYSSGLSHGEHFASFDSLTSFMERLHRLTNMNIYFASKKTKFESEDVVYWKDATDKIKNAIISKINNTDFSNRGLFEINGVNLRKYLKGFSDSKFPTLKDYILKSKKENTSVANLESMINSVFDTFGNDTIKAEVLKALEDRKAKSEDLVNKTNTEFLDFLVKNSKKIVAEIFEKGREYYGDSGAYQTMNFIYEVKKVIGKEIVLA